MCVYLYTKIDRYLCMYIHVLYLKLSILTCDIGCNYICS